jgi:hypothetical protein
MAEDGDLRLAHFDEKLNDLIEARKIKLVNFVLLSPGVTIHTLEITGCGKFKFDVFEGLAFNHGHGKSFLVGGCAVHKAGKMPKKTPGPFGDGGSCIKTREGPD